MNRILLISLMTSLVILSGCNMGHYEYDMATVEANFKACMNATPTPPNAIAFEHKIDGCREASWATTKGRLVK